MTLYDLIALTILGVSLLVGFVRGALREVTTVIAFLLAVVIALLSLRLTTPIARAAVHPAWAATAVAVVVVFLGAYVILRLLAGALGRSVRDTAALGTLDRLIGAGLGLTRGLVLMGLFNLLFHAVTPPERAPAWITQAKLYPVAEASAKALRLLAPRGLTLAHRLTPAITGAVGPDDAGDAQRSGSGQSRKSVYDDAAQKGVDDVVDKP